MSSEVENLKQELETAQTILSLRAGRIGGLESALGTAQTRIVRLEEELKRAQNALDAGQKTFVEHTQFLRNKLSAAEREIARIHAAEDERDALKAELAAAQKELALAARVSVVVPSSATAREEAAKLQEGEPFKSAPSDEEAVRLGFVWASSEELQSLKTQVKEAETRYARLDEHCRKVEAQRKELEQRYIELSDTWNGFAAGVVDPKKAQGRLDAKLTAKAREEGRLARKIARALLRVSDDE